MRYEIVTIFPELIDTATRAGLLGKAVGSGLVEIECITPRQFTTDKHHSVDDAPYGGGSGMVMSAVPIVAALEHLDAKAAERGLPAGHRILLTPAGQPFTQAAAQRLAALPALTLICGRYEGIDERVRGLVQEELSLGDFVLNGGEIAALAVIEATARLLPGMLGNQGSLAEESHSAGVLEYPQYTRPREFRGQEVPAILLSGNHAAIERWRRLQALLRTRQLRPDLFASLQLTAADKAMLAQADAEQGAS
ncbi:MAG TPA: tRNA (guanosine(37)-N1)-methyltransferase TrmD [Polyangiales bacterium]